MNSDQAYKSIQSWAIKLNRRLKDAESPSERAYALAEIIADIRLSNLSDPEEPSRGAVQILVLDYLHAHPEKNSNGSEEHRIGSALESLILEIAKRKIESSENQPYFGCHRTTNTRPPASHSQ